MFFLYIFDIILHLKPYILFRNINDVGQPFPNSTPLHSSSTKANKMSRNKGKVPTKSMDLKGFLTYNAASFRS